jgi:hypothetical protein
MSDSQIPARWLPIVRWGWLALVLLSLAIFLAGVLQLYQELRQPCSQEECPYPALLPQEAQTLEELGLSMDIYVAYMVGLEFFILAIVLPPAVLIFWRMSDIWMGILLSLTLVFLVRVPL